MTFAGIVLSTSCPKENKYNVGTKKKPDWRFIPHDSFCECDGRGEVLTKEGEELMDFIHKFGRFASEDHGHSF